MVASINPQRRIETSKRYVIVDTSCNGAIVAEYMGGQKAVNGVLYQVFASISDHNPQAEFSVSNGGKDLTVYLVRDPQIDSGNDNTLNTESGILIFKPSTESEQQGLIKILQRAA